MLVALEGVAVGFYVTVADVLGGRLTVAHTVDKCSCSLSSTNSKAHFHFLRRQIYAS